jgi:sucrose-6-phosphate hydrolase SacC (GH32 family)
MMPSPVQCHYAPPGEYVKDHTIVWHDHLWHLYSISGTQGYSHLYSGNEETVSWNVSENLADWDFRGHVLHASLRSGEFDQHEVWSPYCLAANGRFYMFYTGVRHPVRPMCREKFGTNHPEPVWEGHRETIGLAVSEDLTSWEKVSDRDNGLSVPGRDPHVVYDPDKKRWLLFSTGKSHGGVCDEYVSSSNDLVRWEFLGICASFPQDGFPYSTTESVTVMKHPSDDRWIMLGNWHYAISDDPENFRNSTVHRYFDGFPKQQEWLGSLGFAGEMIHWNGRWYRSGVLGVTDYWVLGFHQIAWDRGGAFHIERESQVK